MMRVFENYRKMLFKFDLNFVLEIFMCVIGGEVGVVFLFASKIGSFGLSSKKVGEDIAKEIVKDWKGLCVMVKFIV